MTTKMDEAARQQARDLRAAERAGRISARPEKGTKDTRRAAQAEAKAATRAEREAARNERIAAQSKVFWEAHARLLPHEKAEVQRHLSTYGSAVILDDGRKVSVVNPVHLRTIAATT